MRAPAAPSTRRSASRNTRSACSRSVLTTHTLSSARCHRSWWSVSAAETLKRLCSRSLRLFNTWRFSFRDLHAARCSSQLISPTTPPAAAHHRAHDLHHLVPLADVADLDVVEVRDPHAPRPPLPTLAH